MDTNKLIQKDDQYVIEYGDKYISKIDYLSKLITEQETGENKFKVINLEAGLGKSYYSDIIIREYLHTHAFTKNKRKFLIVKRFNDESDNSAITIESGFLQEIVAVITSETWQDWKLKIDELIQKPVIIISHKRYIDLCLNDEDRFIFIEGRHTLIIDEKMNFPIYTYTDEFYSRIRGLINNVNRDIFDKTCENLHNILDEHSDSTACCRVYPEINEDLLQQFKNMMNGEMANSNLSKKRLLEEFLDTVCNLYNKDILAIINSKNISTLNRYHKHWGLDNNIILDASAGIDGIYKANDEKYILQRQTPFIDHSESEIIHIKCNSSMGAIKNNQKEYFEKMIELITERHKENEKTLIVVHKRFADYIHKQFINKFGFENVWKDKEDKETDLDYNDQQFAISWMGNLIGKNDFKDFNNVWILATPNIPMNNYLVQYMQYGDKTLGKKGLGIYQGRFKNDEFRAIQEGYIASEIYQSIKRIQRNAKPKGKFYIVNRDEIIINKVLSHMKNATITEEIEVKFEEDEQEKKITKIDQISQYIKQIIKDGEIKKIPKSDVKKLYGSIRWDRVKEHPDIKELMKKGKLKEQQRYFVVS